MSLALLSHYLMLNIFRMLVRPSSGAYDLLWIYFMCCIALVRCVLVLRFGSPGVMWYVVTHTHDIRIYSGNIIKTHYTLENSRTIRHRSKQYLQ